MWWLILATAFGWEERGMDGVGTGRTLAPAALFRPTAPAWRAARVSTVPLDLGMVARETASTIRRLRSEGDLMAQPAMLGELGVSMDDVLQTLDLISRVSYEDRGMAYQRLEDPAWIASQFWALRWYPDREAAAARGVDLYSDAIRLTKYVVYTVEGSPVKTDRFDTALYAVPRDESDGSPGVRARLTRMEVYAGAFEEGGQAEGLAQPLVWLTRDGSNQALLQGTIRVNLPNGSSSLYNVHQNNGVAWDPSQRNLSEQPRFWYFRRVEAILGVEQTPLRPRAAVAGDVYNLGLGKLIALEWPGEHGPELHLVVLADTGGAFQPNLFQLDYLAGTFPSKEAYQRWAEQTPAQVPATVLVRRR